MAQTPRVKVVVIPRPRMPRVDGSSLVALAGRSRHALAGLVALTIGAGLLGGPFVETAAATPVASTWSAASSATLAKVGITAVGNNLATVGVGPATGTADSSSAKHVVADVSTLGATVAGLSVPVAVAHQEGPADNATPASNGAGVGVSGGLLNVQAITGTAGARWAGDSICVPNGTTLSSTTTGTAGLAVGTLLSTGALKSSTSTGFAAGSDASHTGLTATTTTESVDVALTSTVTVHVPKQVATVTASGTTGGATANFTDTAPTVTVGSGAPITLTKGTASTYGNGTISVKYNGATTTQAADGRSATVTSTGLITISVNVLGLAATTVDLFPLNATVSAPAGGINCVVPAPVITAPATGAVVNSRNVAVSGTGIAGATVTVKSGSTTVGTATVSPTGTWSTTAVLPTDGAATLTATQTAYSQTSGASNSVALSIDSTPPAKPVITSPVQNAPVKAMTYQLTGTAEPAASVLVSNGTTTFGPVTATAGGSWTVLVVLAEGQNSFTAVATDAAGNASVPSGTWTITADNTAPVKPVIQAPTSGTVTKDTKPVVSGTAEPGSMVTLMTASGSTLGSAAADASGHWSITPAGPLAEGANALVAISADTAGNQSSSDQVLVTVDTAAPAAPAIVSPQNSSTGSAPLTSVTGTGEPGATVAVVVDGNSFGTAVVDNSGHWTVTRNLPTATGSHSVVAAQTDAAGNTSTSTSVTYSMVPAPNAVSVPVVAAPGGTSLTAANTIGGTVAGAVAGDTVTITVAPGQGTTGNTQTLTADASSGQFSAPVTLADGTWIVTATHTTAGVTSGSSAPVTLLVDSTRPDAPAITAPVAGETVTSSTPLVTGNAEPGSTVHLTVGGQEVGSGSAGADGTFAIVVGSLPEGAVTVTANAVDAYGRNSTAATRSFVVDALPPAPVTITAPAAGAAISGPVTVSGAAADPGANVTVMDELGRTVGSAIAQADGTWSLNAGTFADGQHTLTAVQADRFGRGSAPASVQFVADATAPNAVVVSSPQGTTTVKSTIPAISGAGAEPGATVQLRGPNGAVLATVTAGSDGSFSLPSTAVPAGTPDGSLTVGVFQIDRAGNVSAGKNVQFTVDTFAAPPVITAPGTGSTSSNTRPSISGTAEPLGSVVVTLDGVAQTAVPVAADGTWTFRPATTLADGNHTVTAVQTDALGNVSGASTGVTFTTDTQAAPPAITSALIDANGTSTVSGTAEPSAHVVLRRVTLLNGTPVVGEADADANGNWVIHPTSLSVLDILTATQTDPSGNTSSPSLGLKITLGPVTSPSATATATSTATTTATTTSTTTATATPTETCLALGLGCSTAPATSAPATSAPATSAPATSAPTTDPTSDPTSTGVLCGLPVLGSMICPTASASPSTDPTSTSSATSDPSSTATSAPVTSAPATSAPTTDPTSDPTSTGVLCGLPVFGSMLCPTASASPSTDPTSTSSATSDPSSTVTSAPVTSAPTTSAPTTDPTSDPTSTGVLCGLPVFGSMLCPTASASPSTDPTSTTTTTTTSSATSDPSSSASPTENCLLLGLFCTPVTPTQDPTSTATSDPSSTVTSAPTIDPTTSASPTQTNAACDVPLLGGLLCPTASASPSSSSSDPTSTATTDPTSPSTASPTPTCVLLGLICSSGTQQPTQDPTATGTTSPTGGTATGTAGTTPCVTSSIGAGGISISGTCPTSTTSTTAPTTTAPTTTAPTTTAPTTTAPTTTPTATTSPTATVVSPKIVVPANGYVTSQGNQLLSGTAAPGSTVTVKDGDTVIGTVTADAQGRWSMAPTQPFAVGRHNLVATQVTTAGVASTSPVNVLTINAAAGIGPVITGPVNGTVTPNTRPKFFGTAAPGSTVTLRSLNGTVLGTAVAAASAGDPTVGTWVITSAVDLPVGDTTAIATQVKAGVALTSNTTTVTIDPNAPAPVVIDTPLDLTVTADGSEDVTGTGEPGGYVKLLTNNPEDANYPGVTVDSNGRWVFKNVRFDLGVHYVYATQDVQWSTGMVSKVYGRGATTQSRSGVQLLSARTAVLLADPTMTDVSSTSQTVRVLRSTAAASAVVAKPVISTPTEGQVLAGNRPTITGTGEPGATITVLDNAGNVLGVALVAADGTWSLVPAAALPVGTTSIRAVETLADGTAVGTSDVRSFVVPAVSESTPAPTDTTTPTPAPSTNSTPAPTTTTPATGPAASTGSATGAKASTGSATVAKASTGSSAGAKVSTAAKVSKLAHTGADLAPLFLGILLLVSGLGAILVAQRGRLDGLRGSRRVLGTRAAPRSRVATPAGRSISLHSNDSAHVNGGGGVALLAPTDQRGDHGQDEVSVVRTPPGGRRWTEPDALAGMPLLGGPPSRAGTGGTRRPADHLRGQRAPGGGRRRKR